MSPSTPGWIVDDAESIRREVEPYLGMSDDDRAAQLVLVCRAAARLVAANDDPARVLAYRDPVPEESARRLASLRAAYKRRGVAR